MVALPSLRVSLVVIELMANLVVNLLVNVLVKGYDDVARHIAAAVVPPSAPSVTRPWKWSNHNLHKLELLKILVVLSLLAVHILDKLLLLPILGVCSLLALFNLLVTLMVHPIYRVIYCVLVCYLNMPDCVQSLTPSLLGAQLRMIGGSPLQQEHRLLSVHPSLVPRAYRRWVRQQGIRADLAAPAWCLPA